MKIEEMHLQDKEIARLVDYLIIRDYDDLGKKVSSFQGEGKDLVLRIFAQFDQVMSRPESKARREQLEERARDYQLVSSFGIDRENIFRNSRIHFLGCENCYGQYNQEVERITFDQTKKMREVEGAEMTEFEITEITESPSYKDQLFFNDVLKILDHPEIFGMGIT